MDKICNMAPKRPCKFNGTLQKFKVNSNLSKMLKQITINDYEVYCIIIYSNYYLVSHGGRSNINDHLKTKKYKTWNMLPVLAGT